MPFILEHSPSINCYIGVWNIEEEVTKLTDELNPDAKVLEYLATIRHPRRKAQWLAGRLLLKKLTRSHELPEMYYDDHQKPHFRDGNLFLSIAHCQSMAVGIVSEDHVGIDVELIQDKILNLKEKFLSPVELSFIDRENELIHLTLCWSAKEALYKLWGKRKLQFNEHIILQAFKPSSQGKLLGCVKKDGVVIETTVYFQRVQEYFVTWCCVSSNDYNPT